MVSVFDLLVLSQIPQLGPNRIRMLVSHFRDTAEVLRASAREIAAIPGFSRKLAATIIRSLKDPIRFDAEHFAEKQLSRLNNVNGIIVTFWDAMYPEHLKRIYDPPLYFYLLGELRAEDKYALAVVGTRDPTEYGIGMVEQLASELSRVGITVVSGLARGIDTVAHSHAIRTGGRTIAVTGSGLDIVYPPENKTLYHRIPSRGAIITEYGMGAKPDATNFPRRNRVISGLSLGTIVVETDITGGAMITATSALDQNREVFAIPGCVTSRRSRGCHALIKEGRAKLIESIDDVLVELSHPLRPLLKSGSGFERPTPEMTLFERSIYDCLSEVPLHIDQVAEKSGSAIADALVSLLSMEFKGLVKQYPGKRFTRI